jgi:hypothetical protein
MRKILLYLILLVLVLSPYIFCRHIFAGQGIVPGPGLYVGSTGTTVGYLALTGTTTFTIATGTTTQTFSAPSGALGSNRCLFITASYFSTNGTSITGMTYAGVAAVHAPSAPLTGSVGVSKDDFWYVIAPATGSNNLVVTWNAAPSATGALGVSVFTGVNQTTPLSGYVGATGTSVSLTIPTGGAAIDSAYGTAMSNPSQTKIYADNTPAVANSSQYCTTVGTTTFSWTGPQIEIGYSINHQ